MDAGGSIPFQALKEAMLSLRLSLERKGQVFAALVKRY